MRLIVCMCSVCQCYHSGSSHGVMSLITQAYSETAVKGFRTVEVIWQEFQHAHNVSDVYLRNQSLVDAEEWVLEFLVHLIDDMGFTGSQITRTLTQLRGMMLIHGGCYSVFDSKRLELARKSIRFAHASLLSSEVTMTGGTVGAPAVQLPLTVGLLDRIRELYWVGQPLTSRMIYIGTVASFFRGLRVSNVAATGSTGPDHRFRLEDIRIEVDAGFLTVKEWLDTHAPPVLALKITIRSSKTHGPTKKKKSVAPIVLMAGVGSDHEQQWLADLLDWIKGSGMREQTDLLFARWDRVGNRLTATYKMLQSSDIANAIKRVVAEEGLDPARFSTRSCRIGANVEVSAQGASSGQRMMVLDHTDERNNELYLRAMHHRDPNPLSAGGSVTTRDVITMERYL